LAFSGSFSVVINRNIYPMFTKVKRSYGIFIMLGILFQIILSSGPNMVIHGKENMSHIPWLLFISLCIHAFRGLSVGHHEDNLAIGIAIHHLPIANPHFSLTQLNTKAIFVYDDLCGNDTTRYFCIRLFSGFKPIHHPNHRCNRNFISHCLPLFLKAVKDTNSTSPKFP
jgi:hypothetical protein